jgi:signal transduction histidine kinase
MWSVNSVAICRHETRLILLNLTVLAGIATVHVLFAPILGQPSLLFFVLLVSRFVMQTAELTWLQSQAPKAKPELLLRYARASIWLNLLFAFALSRVSGIEDSHYVVLMVIPVIAAAFRYGAVGLTLVGLSAALATFVEVRLYNGTVTAGRGLEYFEAASVILIYAVVAVVVWLLVRQVREEQAQLASNLEELQLAKDRLVREEKLAAIGRFASGIAHEIRNPVAVILSSAEMAASGRSGISREELDAIVLEESRRLSRLTTDFLEYARGRSPEMRSTELSSLLGYVADATRAVGSEAGVAVELAPIRELAVMVDPFQIHQALVNLTMNGISASVSGGRVTIGAEEREDGLSIWVENDGDAIPPETIPKLFEPFFTTRERGTGLGLPIAKAIAEAHGGDLQLSRNESGCVRFSIDIPRCIVPRETACHES